MKELSDLHISLESKLFSERFPLPVHESKKWNFVQKGSWKKKNVCLTDK